MSPLWTLYNTIRGVFTQSDEISSGLIPSYRILPALEEVIDSSDHTHLTSGDEFSFQFELQPPILSVDSIENSLALPFPLAASSEDFPHPVYSFISSDTDSSNLISDFPLHSEHKGIPSSWQLWRRMEIGCDGLVDKIINETLPIILWKLIIPSCAIVKGLEKATTRAVVDDLVMKETPRLGPSKNQLVSYGIRAHLSQGKPIWPPFLRPAKDDMYYYEGVTRKNISVSHPTLQPEDWATLYPETWLNDIVINAYLDLLCQTFVGVANLGSYFYTRLSTDDFFGLNIQDGHTQSNSIHNHANANNNRDFHIRPVTQCGAFRWIRRKQNIFSPSKTRLTLIPINFHRSHWSLIVVDNIRQEFVYYDSLYQSSERSSHTSCSGKDILDLIAHFFSAASKESHKNNKSFPSDGAINYLDWPRRSASSIKMPPYSGKFPISPKSKSIWCGNEFERDMTIYCSYQNNTWDCGVFLCLFARCIAEGRSCYNPINQSYMPLLRQLLVHELMLEKISIWH